jgi:alpha-D-ribose 1-methylphosphonate 5-triphosphate synthase subunit PhnH
VVHPDELPELASLAQGTEESPHLSATVVLDVRGAATDRCTGTGPGIDGSIAIDVPRASRPLLDDWRRNGARFPRGVDLLLVDDHQLTALPRTTRLAPTGTEA